MSPVFQQKKLRIKATLKYLLVLILILLVAVFQDYLYRQNFDHSVYETEKRLINSLWILLFPVALIWNLIFKKIGLLANVPVLLLKRILFILLATVSHILVFAGLAAFFSGHFYGHNIPFSTNIKFIISVDLYKYLLIYSVISLILIKKERNVKPN
ncbi:hypothetical protein PBT90_19275 [Algoriphagus halophytocola]|uniref:Uncharacterized protein n=1 Tax=Algoriphagus halophytocola TaxID=2991499 RepID=A0ABY6MES4_9BACT|nr:MULTISPECIES: hypothetical protein [unclassified Algoriphagus]UZD21658.1 hypothetical protein OM944_13410 [Algoriphagus sp. TR-M5]WBL42870.1 hypothetical protein PBT90_19275 [Algoriphagus sp. TR-M9]